MGETWHDKSVMFGSGKDTIENGGIEGHCDKHMVWPCKAQLIPLVHKNKIVWEMMHRVFWVSNFAGF